MSSNIPRAREILIDLIKDLEEGPMPQHEVIDEVLDALMLMTKEFKKKRAPRESTPASDELKKEIALHAKRNPSDSAMTIAKIFNVNIGRVSEAIGGDDND